MQGDIGTTLFRCPRGFCQAGRLGQHRTSRWAAVLFTAFQTCLPLLVEEEAVQELAQDVSGLGRQATLGGAVPQT